MAEEVTLNQNYRAVAAAASTISYTDVYNKAPGDAAYSNPSGMFARQDAWFPSGSYLRWNIYRSFLYFDTSEIPEGAVVTDAQLQIYVTHNYTYRTHNIVIQNGQPTYPTNPIGVWSYYRAFYSGDGGSITSSAISTNAWNTITLNDDGKDWINCGGETKLCLRVSRDIDGDSPGSPPEGASAREEGIRLYQDPVDGVYAKLVITYAEVEVEVTTQAVTDITHEDANGHGTITDTGGENCTKRGICWNTIGNPTIADNKSEETGDFGVGAFTRPITGLDEKTTYYVKAYAYNSAGYAYGAQVEFTTTAKIPVVTIQDVTDITVHTATANGTVVSGENIIERGFEYGKTKSAEKNIHETGEDLGLGAYSLPMTNL